jgi:CRISPR/Cas system CSM-associated protein Csm2 small subunit
MMPEKFYDQEGTEVSLERLCCIEPGWAANQIRRLYKENERFKAESEERAVEWVAVIRKLRHRLKYFTNQDAIDALCEKGGGSDE